MITFLEFILSGNFPVSQPPLSREKGKKLKPIINPTIPIKIGYGSYLVFRQYIDNPKFKLCEDLLERRGDTTNFVSVLVTIEELANLKELANYILINYKDYNEKRIAEITLKKIKNFL
jgi:hypothetical protein